MPPIEITAPFGDDTVLSLKAGDRVLISGTVYTARDAAHKRMVEEWRETGKLPVDLQGQIIYYVGPTPAKPHQAIGSAGPTTSGRMDSYTPLLLELGLKGMIGKGYRNEEVRKAIMKHRAVYFGAIGGSGALIARTIKKVETVAYDDLGTEAIRRLTIERFPAVVVNDVHGNDWYRQSAELYRVQDNKEG